MAYLTLKGKVISVQDVEALGVARGWGSHIFRHSATNGGKVVSPTRRLLFNPRRFLILISVGGWVDPRAVVRLEGLGKLKKKKIHLIRDSNRRPSGLQHSVSTHYATSCPPFDTCYDICVELKTEKTILKITSVSLEDGIKFKYIGRVTYQNYIHWEVKRNLNAENYCYRLAQNPLTCRLLLRSLNMKITYMKNAIFWDVARCRFCVNWRFGGTYRLQLPDRKIGERGTSVSRWLQPLSGRGTIEQSLKSRGFRRTGTRNISNPLRAEGK
jgi:hypothetical protein